MSVSIIAARGASLRPEKLCGEGVHNIGGRFPQAGKDSRAPHAPQSPLVSSYTVLPVTPSQRASTEAATARLSSSRRSVCFFPLLISNFFGLECQNACR
jgi:hypothetical protein